MIWHGKIYRQTKFGENHVTAALTVELPTRLFKNTASISAADHRELWDSIPQ
jgi:hypothetical protein